MKGGKPSVDMFNNIEIQAYGDKYPLSELGQCMPRGETNILINLYDESVKGKYFINLYT